MQYNTPIQLIREYILHDNKKSQDAATKAWNLCTPFYYKGFKLSRGNWTLMKTGPKHAISESDFTGAGTNKPYKRVWHKYLTKTVKV